MNYAGNKTEVHISKMWPVVLPLCIGGEDDLTIEILRPGQEVVDVMETVSR